MRDTFVPRLSSPSEKRSASYMISQTGKEEKNVTRAEQLAEMTARHEALIYETAEYI